MNGHKKKIHNNNVIIVDNNNVIIVDNNNVISFQRA